MEVRVAQARHQGRAHSVDNRLRPAADRATHARGSLGHMPNAIALNADFPRVRVLAGAIQDADIGEEHAARAIGPVGSIVAVRHRYSSLSCRRPNFWRSTAVSSSYTIKRRTPSRVRSEGGRNLAAVPPGSSV